MTVKYNLDVSTSRPWTLFKLLFRWRGSIWKSVVLELFVWLLIFAIISVVYRMALDEEQMRIFEQFVHYCDDKLNYIPLNFMLGFFVTSVVSRWVNFFINIGYIDNIALMVAAYVHGSDEKSRMMRRNIVRYCVLSQTLVFRDISMRVRKRFPTMETVVAAGFMMEHEKKKFDEIQYRYAKYWMPFQWALSLCQEARVQQKITSDILLEKVGEEIKFFRTNMAILCNFDWVPLPIMYPQLIVLAVHAYFLVASIARQFVISEGALNKSRMDIYFPFMTSVQFIFYMGWLKVAEAMLNPFGEDDDDFECNFLLDKNLSVGLTIVDAGYKQTPALIKDVFWSEKEIEPLYSAQSAKEEHRTSGVTGSTANVIMEGDGKIEMLPLPHENENSHSAMNPFGFLRNSLQRRLKNRDTTSTSRSDRRHSLLSVVLDKFERSVSHGNCHDVPDGDKSGRKYQSSSELFEMSGKHSSGTDLSDNNVSSLGKTLDAIITESNAYNNPSSTLVDDDGQPLTMKDVTSRPDRRAASHLNKLHNTLEDLAEENDDSANSKKDLNGQIGGTGTVGTAIDDQNDDDEQFKSNGILINRRKSAPQAGKPPETDSGTQQIIIMRQKSAPEPRQLKTNCTLS